MVIRRAWLPVSLAGAVYAATSLLGALVFMTGYGRALLTGQVDGVTPAVLSIIGSPVYLFIVLHPLVVTPLAAFAGIKLARYLSGRLGLSDIGQVPNIRPWVVILLLAASAAFCAFKLLSIDLLSPDSSTTYRETIIYRTNLFSTLSFFFYAVLFGMMPILLSMVLAEYLRSRHIPSLVALIFGLLAFDALLFLTQVKSHIMVTGILFVCTAILMRQGLMRLSINLVTIGALTLCSFSAVEIAQRGWIKNLLPTSIASRPSITLAPESPLSPEAKSNSPRSPQIKSLPPEIKSPDQSNGYVKPYWQHLIDNLSLRMAISIPFYISVFSDPAERCGIEGRTVRSTLRLPDSKCSITEKISNLMWPSVTWVQGNSPAAANITAYGEIGVVWSVFVSIFAGFVLGLLGGITEWGDGPFFIALNVSFCAFAYYVTQTAILAPFTYHHGLIFFTAPVFAAAIISALIDRIRRT